jgi:hypothetical protein
MSDESELESRRLDRGPVFEALIKKLDDIIGQSGAKPDLQMNAWHAAFCVLVRNDDGKPLAKLLRSGRLILAESGYVLIPSGAAYALAELFDPKFPSSPYVEWSPPAPHQTQMDDGKKRFKAAIEVKDAWGALMVECERLVKQAKKSRVKLDESYLTTLEELAKEHGDEKALRAFAAHRNASAKLSAAKNATHPAVRLTVKPLSEKHRAHLSRNDRIVTEMVVELQQGRSSNIATQIIGERFGLTDRSVKKIWTAAREAMPDLDDFGKPLVK